MNKDIDESSWVEWRRLIFSEIERHEIDIKGHVDRITKVELSVAKLQLIATISGAIGGICAAGIIQLFLKGT